MDNRLFLQITGAPIAKKRPRFVRRGKFVGTYNPQETEEGRYLCEASGQISTQLKGPITEPLKISFKFVLPIPQSMSKKEKASPPKHVKKPDIDNLIKFSLDCLNGYLFVDDRQIYSIEAVKEYGELPMTKITVAW